MPLGGHDAVAWAVTLGIIAVVVALVGHTTMSLDARYDWEQAEDWCADHDGELIMVNSVNHGGLHCELPDGELVHMNGEVTQS